MIGCVKLARASGPTLLEAQACIEPVIGLGPVFLLLGFLSFTQLQGCDAILQYFRCMFICLQGYWWMEVGRSGIILWQEAVLPFLWGRPMCVIQGPPNVFLSISSLQCP